MKIIRAEHLGMCFGVRDAIELAFQKGKEGPITILGELVHNAAVLQALKAQGIEWQNEIEKVSTRAAMITAHGASNRALERARNHGLEIVQATCPLVHHAHRAVARMVEEGYHPVIIGKRNHVEVRGLTEDLDSFDVIQSEEDVQTLLERPRFGIAAQTTQPIERVQRLVGLIRQRFPKSEVRFSDTVCQPTKQRQNAAIELAKRCDAVIVVGGANSNNTHELAATCRRYCSQVFHVQNAEDLQESWCEKADLVGITAGTSTPDPVIESVETRLKEFAARRAQAEGRPDGALSRTRN